MLTFRPDAAFPVYEVVVLIAFFIFLIALAQYVKSSAKVKKLVGRQGGPKVSQFNSSQLDKTTRLLELKVQDQNLLFLETEKGLVQIDPNLAVTGSEQSHIKDQ